MLRSRTIPLDLVFLPKKLSCFCECFTNQKTAADFCSSFFYTRTDGNRFRSVWGINFAPCIRMRKSGIDANWTQ